MNPIEVYHGSTEIISRPLCHVGREFLDFGKGFYVTNFKDQALRWAIRSSKIKKVAPVINVYYLDKDAFYLEARCKIFKTYSLEWLRFIVANRRGENIARGYDYIEGGVANDRIINTINMYMEGYYDEKLALQLLSFHKPNNQICLLNQILTDKYLLYDRTEKP